MRLNKKRIMLVGVVLLLGSVLWLLLISPEMKSQKAIERYKIGMSSDEIGRLRKQPVQLTPSGVVYPYEPSEDDKRMGFFYSAYFAGDGVYLQFNYYRELVRITRVSPLQKLRAFFGKDN